MTGKKQNGVVLLVTAFEPFDGAKTNSSLIMLEKMKEQDWEGKVAFFGPVPVSFEDAWPLIEQEMRRYPDLQGVIAMGQAEGCTQISLERMALNVMHASKPDNYGCKPEREPVEKGEPVILKSKFPWHTLEESPHWECTYRAGTYVCNTVMYSALNWARKEDKIAGFVHLPLVESQKGDPGLGKDSPRMKDAVAEKSLTRILHFALESLEPAPAPKLGPAPSRKHNSPPAP
jgi:pyroglutamyl-peptidase